MEKGEPLYIVGGMVNCSSPYRKQYVGFFKYQELPYDPAISLVGIYLSNMKKLLQKTICTLMFIAALFTIAKVWKQHKYPLAVQWLKKMWHIRTMEYY